jgi:hypothetical protein
MLLCPNISHPDWKYSVSKLGKDKTLYLFDLLGQQIPTKEDVDYLLLHDKEPGDITEENFLKPDVDYTTVDITSEFEEKNSLLDKFNIKQSKLHYYYEMTEDEQKRVDAYYHRQGGKRAFGNTKLGFTLYEGVNGVVTFKYENGHGYLYIDNKEYYTDKDGIKLPRYVGSFKVPVDLVNHGEEKIYLQNSKDGTEYIPLLEKEVRKYLFKTKNVSLKKSGQYYMMSLGTTIINVYKRLFNKDITFDQIKNITVEEAQALYDSVDFKAKLDDLEREYKEMVDQMDIVDVKDNILLSLASADGESGPLYTNDELVQMIKLLNQLPEQLVKVIDIKGSASNRFRAFFSHGSAKNKQSENTLYNRSDIHDLTGINRLRHGISINISLRDMLKDGIITSETIDNLNNVIRKGVEAYVKELINRGMHKKGDRMQAINRADFYNKGKALKAVLTKEQYAKYEEYFANTRVAVDEFVDSTNQGLTYLSNLIAAGSGAESINTLFTEIRLGNFNGDSSIKNSISFNIDNLTIAGHELGHAMDMYLATVKPVLRQKIINYINNLIETEEFKNYIKEGLESRGYDTGNKKEIIADLFAYVTLKSIGYDLTKGHLASLDEFFKVNYELAERLFKEQISPNYYEEYNIKDTSQAKDENKIVTLFREILNAIINAINTFAGRVVYNPITANSKTITTNLTATKYNIGNIFTFLNHIVTDSAIYDIGNVMRASPASQQNWKYSQISQDNIVKETKEQFIARMNSRIENGFYKQRDGKLVPVTDTYNPETWWVERQEKLSNFDNVGNKVYNKFTLAKAMQKVHDLVAKYGPEGYTFRRYSTYVPSAKTVRVTNSSPNNRAIWQIEVCKPLDGNKLHEILTLDDIAQNNDINEIKITEFFKSLNGKDNNKILEEVLKLELSNNTKNIITILKNRLVDNPTLKVVISDEEYPEQAGDYDVLTNTATIYKNAFIEEYSNIESVGKSFAHELLHSFTYRALINNSTFAEKKFYSTIKRLYEISRKETKYRHTPAYRTKNDKGENISESEKLAEFIAYSLTQQKMIAELKGMKLKWWERFVISVRNLMGIKSSVYDYALSSTLSFVTNDFKRNPVLNSKFTPKVKRELDKDIYLQQDEPSHKKIWDNLNYFDSQFEIVQENGNPVYIHSDSGQRFSSVPEMMDKMGINHKLSKDNKVRETQLLWRKKASDIRNVVSAITDADLRKVAISIADNNELGYNERIIDDIHRILKRFDKPGNTILSNVMVTDTDRLLADTIDMVVIDENNKVHIYKFENRQFNFSEWNKQTRFGGSQNWTDRQRASYRLSAQADFFEKMTGIQVTDMNVVMLHTPLNKEGTITSVSLDSTQAKTGIDTVPINRSIIVMYKDAESHVRNKIDMGLEDKVDVEFYDKLADEEKDRLKDRFDLQRRLTDKEEIVKKSIEALIYKKQLLSRRGRSYEIESMENKISDLLAEKDTEKCLVMILNFATRESNRIWNEYESYRAKGKEVPLTILYGWRDSVSAFDSIMDSEDGLNSVITRLEGLKNGPSYRKELMETMGVISSIKGLYEALGTDRLVELLYPYYNRLYAELKLKKQKEYRRLKFKGELPSNITESEYVNKALDDQSQSLEDRTKELIRTELKKASKDINVLTRWIDNLLDSTDPVTAAMVRAFAMEDEDARMEAINKRDEFTVILRRLESDFRKRNGRAPKSNEELYDFMLEKDDEGNLTGHYITAYKSEMMEEYRRELNIAKEYETAEERRDHMSNWIAENMPLNKAAFVEAYDTFLVDQLNLKVLSPEGYQTLKDQALLKKKLTITQMIENRMLTEEEGDLIHNWRAENTWQYRMPVAKWENKQWNSLSKILKDGEDVRGEFYTFIVNSRREADKNVPFGFRLDSRLPGVIKQNHERFESGQSVVDITVNSFKDAFTFRVDDTRRHTELVDEAGNAKYFLPVHYTGRVTKEVKSTTAEGREEVSNIFDASEQSFDIAGIYYKYWSSANDYNHKARILPEMELAKFLIDKRSAVKRDSRKNPITRRSTTIKGKEISGGEVLTRNTQIAQQVHDWFLSCVYGQTEKGTAQIGSFDVGKFVNILNYYTAINLLGMNFVAGVANVAIGETLERIEGIALEYVNPKDWFEADKWYLAHMRGTLADIGARAPKNISTKLYEWAGALDDYGQADMDKRTRFGQLVNGDAAFFTSHSGEHYMQNRFALAMLNNIKAVDSDGNVLGSMLDMVRQGKKNEIIFDSRTQDEIDKGTGKNKIDFDKSKWTQKKQIEWKLKTRGVLSRINGEYGKLGKVAIERIALGRMAYMFRKFIVPGFRRRWGRMEYYERLGQFAEGNYITTGKFIGTAGAHIFGKEDENDERLFLQRLMGNLESFKFAMLREDWATLSDHEKANIARTIGEIGFLVLAIIMANLAMGIKVDTDDPDEERFWAFIAYQAYRLQNELLFYTPKLDSSLSILRSPAASISVIENISKLAGQVFHPFDVYQSGAWKGRPKIYKTLMNMTPIERQFYRLRDIADQISYVSQSGYGGKDTGTSTSSVPIQ